MALDIEGSQGARYWVKLRACRYVVGAKLCFAKKCKAGHTVNLRPSAAAAVGLSSGFQLGVSVILGAAYNFKERPVKT